MDVDGLFGAFDGEEKVSDVQAAEPCVEDGKRKAGSEAGTAAGQPVAKRQALPAEAGAKRELDPVTATGGEGGVELKEGEESSTLREDGTFVKSVRTMHCCAVAGCWKTSKSSTYSTLLCGSRYSDTSLKFCLLVLLQYSELPHCRLSWCVVGRLTSSKQLPP